MNSDTMTMERPKGTNQGAADLVRFQDVHKTFDGKVNAVQDLNLEVREGEFLTFLGPSGSGKTTTLLLLAGFEEPTAGDILVGGRSITQTPPHKRNFGMVFQNYALFPHMSVAENVAFPLVVRGTAKAEALKQATKALDLVQLGGLASRHPHQLSGGQQQRTALARALVFDPTLVLMDEPFGALDKKLREQMQMEVKQIHRRLGNTMISVTHDQAEALTMSDRIAVFNKGELQQVAPPKELYERPRNAFVARFVGEINMLDGIVEDVSGDMCKVRARSGSVVAMSCAGISVGQRLLVGLRPEKVSLDVAGGAPENRLIGKIADVVYWGDHVRYHVVVDGEQTWLVKAAVGAGGRHYASGDTIEMTWRPPECFALHPGD